MFYVLQYILFFNLHRANEQCHQEGKRKGKVEGNFMLATLTSVTRTSVYLDMKLPDDS